MRPSPALRKIYWGCYDSLASLCAGAGRRVFAWIPVAWGAGILSYFAPRYEPGTLSALIVLLLGGVTLVLGWRNAVSRCLGGALAIMAGGFLSIWIEAHTRPPMPYLPRHAVVVEGKICGISLLASRKEGQPATRRIKLCRARLRDWLNDGMAPLHRYILIRLKPEDPVKLAPGQIIKVRAMLRLPSWPDYPGARDMQREAWFSGEAGRGYALGPVSFTSAQHHISIDLLRDTIARIIARHLAGQEAAIAQTVLVGETGGLGADTRDIFAASGLAHLLAVAGLHLGLVMGFVLFTMRHGLALWQWAALHWPCREISFAIAWVAGCAYVSMTGSHLPALRSLGMATFVMIALLTGRQALSLRSLTLVAMVLLVTRPSSILDISFQMSFSAVLALVCGYEALRPRLIRLHRRRGVLARARVHLLMLAATSSFAGLATLPIVVAHFNVVQPWFILANMVAVPVAGLLVMPMGVLALIAMPFHLEGVFLHIMGWGIAFIVSIARAVAALPIAHIAVPRAPWRGLILYGAALSGFCLTRKWWRVGYAACILLAALTPFLVSRPDILLSADGGLLAIREKNTIYTTSAGFQQKWALKRWVSDFRLQTQPLMTLAHRGTNKCIQDVCRVIVRGQPVLINAEAHQFADIARADWCPQNLLTINLPPARKLCPDAGGINRGQTWREGAYAVTLRPDGPHIETDRTWRGPRLWAPQHGNLGVPNLPLAPAE